MKHSTNTSLVAIGACLSTLVAVCTLQGSSTGAERSRNPVDARAGSTGGAPGNAMESSQWAHTIGAVLLPPNAGKAFVLHPAVAKPY